MGMARRAALRKRVDGEVRSTKREDGLFLMMVTRGERWQIVAANEATRHSKVLDAGMRNTAEEVGTLIQSMRCACAMYGVDWIDSHQAAAMTG